MVRCRGCTSYHAAGSRTKGLRLRNRDKIFFARQITGVEGYVESAAMGLMAGLSVHCLLSGREFAPLPEDTAHGALINYITRAEHRTFQPMNVNFGIFPPLAQKVSKKERGRHYAERALSSLEKWGAVDDRDQKAYHLCEIKEE